MATFWVKFKKQGKIYHQKFNAKSQKELEINLCNQKIFVLSIEPKEDWLEKIMIFQKPKISEVLSAFYQFKMGLKANLALRENLESIQRHTKNKMLQKQFSKTCQALYKGKELSLCFKEAGFSDFICAMISVGQKSGRLIEVVEFIIIELKNTQKNHKILKKILLYPLFVSLVMVAVFLGITLFVLPQFESLFLGFNTNLPLASKSLLFMRSVVLDYGFFILVAVVVFLVLCINLYNKSLAFKTKFSFFLLQIPFLGKVFYFYQTSQFLLGFYWLYKNNLELKEVLEIAIKSVTNVYLNQKLQGIYTGIARGMLIADSFEGSGVWDSLSLQLLHGAKDQEGFLEALEVILSLHQEELQNKSENLLSMMEPAMILVLGVLVLWLALGIFLPLWELPMHIKQ